MRGEAAASEMQRTWEVAMAGSKQHKLEIALQTISVPGHPFRPHAFRILQLFLGEDIGEDPVAWRIETQKKLAKENLDAQKIRHSLEKHRSQFR